MAEKKQNKKAVVIGVTVLVLLAALFAGLFFIFREKPTEGSKHIVITVVSKSQQSTDYDVKTDAEYLRGAMEEAEGLTFSGAESDYGMMVDTVNGERADFNEDGAYWSFYINDEYCNYGIDTQPINDGDRFSIVYTAA